MQRICTLVLITLGRLAPVAAGFLVVLAFSAANASQLLVASALNNTVGKYDLESGAFLGIAASGGGLSDAIGVALGPDARLYVASEDNDRVLRYDPSTGAFIDVFASTDELRSPRDLTFGLDGNLYVVGEGTSNVVVFDGSTGDLVDTLEIPGGAGIPQNGLAFGPNGDLFVTSNDGVLRFEVSSGLLLGTFVDLVNNSIAFGPDGHLYLGVGGGDIRRYDGVTGVFLDVFASGGSNCDPIDIAFGPDGKLYASNFNCNEVTRYDGATGDFLDVFASVGLPTGLAFLPAPPLDEVAGRLLAAAGLLEDRADTIGTFHLQAASAGTDLRIAPGTAVIETFGGSIAGSTVRVNKLRNVDPATGRPREAGATAPCSTGAEPACLQPGEPVDQNLQAFEDLCDFGRGASALDREACPLDLFNSQASVLGPFTPAVSIALSAIASGQPLPTVIGGQDLFAALASALAGGIPLDEAQITAVREAAGTGALATPLIPLSNDGELDGDNGGPVGDIKFDPIIAADGGLEPYLSDEQEAVLGCGAFYQTRCDVDGIDLAQAEAGAFLLSFPGSLGPGWDATDASLAQPGTVGFLGRTPCQRAVNGSVVQLPGCRGPSDPGFDPAVDGTLAGLDNDGGVPLRVQPFTGQPFTSEIAVASWNLLMLLVAISGDADPSTSSPQDFAPEDPFRTTGCSLARPGLCRTVSAFERLSAVEREDDPTGPPRLRWVWETGAEYAIDEATAILAPFLGGRLHAAGPEVARVIGEPTGVDFFATLPAGMAPPESPFVIWGVGPDGIRGTADDTALGAGYGVASACGNGEDDDGDGFFDTEDPGCPFALAEPEDPNCDDGEDNDADGLTDFDDPKCSPGFPYGERSSCGVGAELLLLLPLLWITRWRSRRI